MLEELRDLYQEVILDHGKNPRNFRHPDDANRQAHGYNPMCGDTLVVYLTVDADGVVRDAAFQGKGCAISMASASMMTEILKGLSEAQADHLFKCFHAMCTDGDFDDQHTHIDEDTMDRLRMLSGVREFPMRVKCATLAWHTMEAARSGEAEVSTE